MIRQPIAVLIIATMFLPVLPAAGQGRERVLTVLYTGAMEGELEPCGCAPKTDIGGLPRMSGYILHNRNSLYPYILVDAGNFSDKDSEQGKLKAEAMLHAFSLMKYDAVGFMNNEATFAEDFFVPLIQRYKVPFVSDAYPCKRSVSISRGTLDIYISSRPDDRKEDKLNILVTDKPVSELKPAEGWTVIISSSGEVLDPPLNLNGVIYLAGYPRGKKLGILTLHLDSSGNVTSFEHRFEAPGPDSAEDPLVRAVLDDYDSRVAGLMKAAEAAPAGTTYLGVSKCRECHEPYVKSWEKTKHAAAFASLENAGKALDPECIACHAVGFGEKGGFRSRASTPELANVQCEECHGLDPEHVNDFERPMRPVTEKVCLKCHTAENSPDFNYEAYLKKVIH